MAAADSSSRPACDEKMLGSTQQQQRMMMLDLAQLQDSFQRLLSQANPDHVAAFFYWLDLKVAQFKVFGGGLSQGM